MTIQLRCVKKYAKMTRDEKPGTTMGEGNEWKNPGFTGR